MPALCIVTLGLIGVIFVILGMRHRYYHYAFAHHGSGCGGPMWRGHHRGHFGRGPWARRGYFYRSPLGRLLAELDTTPGQEKVVRDAVSTLAQSARATMKETRATRGALADIFGSAELDKNRLQDWLEGHGERLRALGNDAATSIARIHEVLDDEQRRRLAKLISAGRLHRDLDGRC